MPGKNLPNRDIELITLGVRDRLPEIQVKRMQVTWPADDDDVWWFSIPCFPNEVHVEGPGFPFLIEADEMMASREALRFGSVDEAVAKIVEYLQSVKNGNPIPMQGELYWQ